MPNHSPRYTEIHTEKKRALLSSEMQNVANKIHELFPQTQLLNACPCCKSSTIAKFTEKFGFAIYKCSQCLHLFTNPFPSKAALDYYYNSEFKDFENEFFLESFENRIPIFNSRIKLIESLSAGRNVLDVGSAVGIFIAANKKMDGILNIVACDVNSSACEYLKAKYKHLEVINKNVMELESANFDVVTLWDTFEHIPDPIGLLEAVKRQLRPNGYFVFSTPNTNSFEWDVMRDSHVQLLPPGHVNLYNSKNIVTILQRNGYIVEDIKTMNPLLDLTYIKNVLDSSKFDDSLLGRAATKLMEIIFFEENLSGIENAMRNRLMAGNMVVVAKKND